MRITIVSPHWPTEALPMRGMRHSEQLRIFARAGHAVRAVVPLPYGRTRGVPRTEHDGALVVAHPRYPKLPFLPAGWAVLAERWLFSRAAGATLNGPDVVLAQSVTLPGGLLGRRGRGRPAFVASLHDHEIFELAPRSAAARRVITRTLREADAAVYVSAALRDRGRALAGPHRAEIIPIGVDVFDDVAAMPPGSFTVCCVARLVPRKRVDLLVRAFARLAARRPEARLVIVGDGPERGAVEALASDLRVRDRVELTGELDRRSTFARIARSSVLALPSVLESLGAVYLEAMALGVPALATAGEGIAAYIEDGVSGLLVPPGDEARLERALRDLADDPDRARRIGAAGRARLQAGPFSWRANVDAHLALFRDLGCDRATR